MGNLQGRDPGAGGKRGGNQGGHPGGGAIKHGYELGKAMAKALRQELPRGECLEGMGGREEPDSWDPEQVSRLLSRKRGMQ